MVAKTDNGPSCLGKSEARESRVVIHPSVSGEAWLRIQGSSHK